MKISRLHNKKGFTLVECIVAIAVFAVMTAMVLVIVSSAIQTSKEASDNEHDLNGLVQLVEEDSSVRKYDAADSHILKMKFKGNDINYSVTYNTVSGFKNYIICPYCGYTANNTDFMFHILDTETYKNSDDSLKAANKISYWFNPSGTPAVALDTSDDPTYLQKYWCPGCGKMLIDNDSSSTPHNIADLKCDVCSQTASPYTYNASANTGFKYEPSSGSFVCAACGSTSVMESNVMEQIGAETNFSVSGLFPNAIRYGSIEQPLNKEAKGYITGKDSSGNELSQFTVQFQKISASNSLPDTYVLKFDNYNSVVASTDTVTFTIKLPPGYEIPLKTGSTDYNVTATNAASVVFDSSANKLTINEVNASQSEVRFSLINSISGLSFDSDYGNEGGLQQYWLKLKKGTDTTAFPRTIDDMTEEGQYEADPEEETASS